MAETKNPSFEDVITELEEIVEKMEGGRMSLEESIEAYTRGSKLAATCRRKLADAEARIAKLESDGSLTDTTVEVEAAPVRKTAKKAAPVVDDDACPF